MKFSIPCTYTNNAGEIRKGFIVDILARNGEEYCSILDHRSPSSVILDKETGTLHIVENKSGNIRISEDFTKNPFSNKYENDETIVEF